MHQKFYFMILLLLKKCFTMMISCIISKYPKSCKGTDMKRKVYKVSIKWKASVGFRRTIIYGALHTNRLFATTLQALSYIYKAVNFRTISG